jgi:hypothetical protein
MSAQDNKTKRRAVFGPAKARKLVAAAERVGWTRVQLVRPGSFGALGDPALVAADANSALTKAGLPWQAVTQGDAVWLERL